jgi:hypothetical protein
MLLRTIIAFFVRKECLKTGGICSSTAILALVFEIICKFHGSLEILLLPCQ